MGTKLHWEAARAKDDAGQRGLCQPCLAEPGLGVMLPRACGLCTVCLCRSSPSAGIHPHSLCFARCSSRFQSAARSPVWESVFSPKSCHHVAKDYQYLVCSQTQRGTQRQSQTCRFTFAQPNSSCSEEKQVYTEGEVWCFVKVLLGWLSTENSLEKSLYIFL